MHTVNPDGTDLVAVASGSLLGGQFHYTFPAWSPDSTKLVITGALLDVEKVVQPGGAADLPETFESQV